MAADLGGSQISALLESVPGIANVLRSPVADAIVNLCRAGAGVGPFYQADVEELIQYAVRRGLIGGREGDEVLADVRASGKGKVKPPPPKRPKPPKKPSPFRSKAPMLSGKPKPKPTLTPKPKPKAKPKAAAKKKPARAKKR